MAIDDLACNFERLDDSSMQNIHEEAKQYFEKGICRLVLIQHYLATQRSAGHSWMDGHSLCPFDGYMPLLKEELVTSMKDKMNR
jgi:hypothetical protein